MDEKYTYLGGPHRVDGSIEKHKQPLLSALLIDTVVPLLTEWMVLLKTINNHSSLLS
jgi:hypothetical protein